MDYSKIISKEYVEKELAIHKVPGVGIAVMKDGKQIMAEGFGYKDVEKKLPITPKTMFGIASCSKSFTSAIIAMLVDEGILEYDKPIIEYLPDFRMYDEYATKSCTIRDMLTHRTGIAGHDALWVDNIDRAELFKRLRYIQPNAAFRSITQYNNTIYTLAGHVAERLTGKTWDELVKKRIFKPLGMNNSNTSVTDLLKCDDVATPYWDFKGEVKKVANWNVDLGAPCAGVNTCLDDMCKWVQLHLNKGNWNGKQLVSEKNMDEMHTMQVNFGLWPWKYDEIPPMAGYGMAWFTDTYRGKDIVFHYGEIEGYCTTQAFLPKENIGFVILLNLHKPCILIENSLMYTMIDNLLGLETIDWSGRFKSQIGKFDMIYYDWDVNLLPDAPIAGTSLSHKMDEYVGKYFNSGYGSYEIVKDRAALKGIYRGVEQPMEHYHYETFKVAGIKMDTIVVTAPLTFYASAYTGKIDKFDIVLEPEVDAIVFKRV